MSAVLSIHRVPPRATPAETPKPACTKPLVMPPLDLQGLMQLAQSDRRRVQQTAAESEVHTIQGQRDAQTREARAALERAHQEAANASEAGASAAFWKKCACWAGAVAAVAATACTMGSAAPLAVVAIGVALSVSSPYIGQAVGNATGSEKAGQWTAIACAIGGAAIQMCAGSPTGAATALQAVQVGAAATSATATCVEAVKTYESKKHDANAEDARAEAMGARAAARRNQSEMDTVVEELKGLEASIRRAMDAIGGIGRELNSARDRAAMHLARSC
jgi:hypothetical protein